MMKREKVVSISNWYLVLQLFFASGIFLGSFVLFWMASYMIGLSESVGQIVSLFGAFSIMLVRLTNALLYWKNSGIYVTKKGDHIVKQGGWFVKEDKLLNGVIIANQVTRNPIDQLLGMASIQTGLFGDKKLAGVRYKDIQKYDDAMRGEGNEVYNSIF